MRSVTGNYWHKRAAQTEKERNGVPVVVAEYPLWTFYVRPASEWNKDWHRAVARQFMKPEARALIERQAEKDYEATEADEALDAELTRAAFAEGCLVKWDGVADEFGDPLSCTPGIAKPFLAHFPDIFRALRQVAGEASNYKPDTEEARRDAILGNSRPASGSAPARGGKRHKRSAAAPTAGA